MKLTESWELDSNGYERKIKWECSNCGYEFPPNSGKVKCPQCHNGISRSYILCPCGKWFHGENIKRKYCSVECKNKYMPKGGKKGKHYPNCRRAKVLICATCGKEFRAIGKSKYCSKKCWANRAEWVDVKCPECGREFSKRVKSDKVYCCRDCDLAARRKRIGPKANAWLGGKTRKSKLLKSRKEYQEWRFAVFERDGFKCQKCGSNVRLEAHHIKEQCNYPELIYDIDNGQTLCHECHKKTDNYANKAKKKRV